MVLGIRMKHSLRAAWRRWFRIVIGIGSSAFILSACQTTDGANFLVQDFGNYGKNYRTIEVYRLTPGENQSSVRSKINANHEVVRDETVQGYRISTWMYETWRSSIGPDTLERRTYLHFVNGKLVNWNNNGDVSRAFAVINRAEASTRPNVQPSSDAAFSAEDSARLAKLATMSGRRGQPHALLIGNNKYRHLNRLVTAVNDAQTVGKLLREE